MEALCRRSSLKPLCGNRAQPAVLRALGLGHRTGGHMKRKVASAADCLCSRPPAARPDSTPNPFSLGHWAGSGYPPSTNMDFLVCQGTRGFLCQLKMKNKLTDTKLCRCHSYTGNSIKWLNNRTARLLGLAGLLELLELAGLPGFTGWAGLPGLEGLTGLTELEGL